MRRALLLAAALAMPGLGAAQNISQGVLQFVQPGTTNDTTHGKWINAAECAARTSTDVLLQWNTLVTSGSFPAQASYDVYVSNQAFATGLTECPTTGDQTKNLIVNKIAGPITGKLQTVTGYAVKVDTILTGIEQSTCAVTTDVPAYVCIRMTDGGGGTAKGLATGTITLSVSKPVAPPSVSVGPLDSGKLSVSWGQPNSDPKVYDYVVRCHSVVSQTDSTRDTRDPADHNVDPTDPNATSATLGGLTDGVLYQVYVASRSEAGNESDPPAGPAYGTPVPVADFWELYRQTPGAVEQGGCATAGAGPLALAGLAALVAALRRRK